MSWKRRTKVAMLFVILGIVSLAWGPVFDDVYGLVYGVFLEFVASVLWLKR